MQKYKFEGKELDRTFGLDNYDIHARQYFAMMPTWDRIDPLAEKFYGISPYSYCGGDPVNFGDYDGMDWYYVNDKGFVFNVRRCEENLLIGYNSQKKSKVLQLMIKNLWIIWLLKKMRCQKLMQ